MSNTDRKPLQAWFCRGCQVMGLLYWAERGACWAKPEAREDCPHKGCWLPEADEVWHYIPVTLE